MPLTNIKVSNFKSFEELEVNLNRFNILIGANAAGKSNFIQIFDFIRQIAKSNLNNAISMQGGTEYLQNINIGSSKDLSIKFTIDEKMHQAVRSKNKERLGYIEVFETTYEFSLKFKKGGLGYQVAQDKLNQKFYYFNRNNKEHDNLNKVPGEINIIRGSQKPFIELLPKNLAFTIEDILPFSFIIEQKLPKNSLLLESPLFWLGMFELNSFISSFSIYNFDPKLAKHAAMITGTAELEEDGSNLSLILKDIIENKSQKTKLLNLLKDLLPFINAVGVEKFFDSKSLIFKIQEEYYNKKYIPASFISDGTINITALIVALFFEKRPLTIIEEPERSIHPHLMAKLVDMMKDASNKQQIIVTTHNPELVRYADLEDLLLISRSEEGFSKISRPIESEELRIFLQNEIGIDELYIQNLLGN